MLVDWSLITGYDFFLSYKRNEASQYATRLAQLLKEADFRCFLDDKDASAGTPLTPRLRSALRRSKVLVVVGSPNVAESEWVAEEIAIFSKTRRNIIPINIADGLKRAYELNQAFSVLQDRDLLWLDEAAAMNSGEPSPAVLGGLQKAFQHRRANRNLRLLAGVIVVALALAAITAYWQKVQADHARDQAIEAGKVAAAERDNARKQAAIARTQEAIAKQQRDLANNRLSLAESQAFASDARRQMVPELRNALIRSVLAYQTSPSLDAQMALVESLSRAAKVKKYFLCDPGEKATGVTFSTGNDPLLAYSCFAKGFTRIIVVSLRGKLQCQFKVSGDGRSIAFIDRSHLGIGGSRDLRILTIASGRIDAYHGHSATITSLASGTATSFFSADAVGEIRVWKRKGKDNPLTTPSEVLKKISIGPIVNLIYSPGTGTLLVIGYSDQTDSIHLNDTEVDQVNQRASQTTTTESDCSGEHPPSTRYRTVAAANDGSEFAYSTESNDIVVLDPNTKLCKAILPGHTHNILSMAFSADGGKLASAGAVANADETHGVILWDLAQVHPLATSLPSTGTIFRSNSKIALSANGMSWACINCGSTLVWDGKEVVLPNAVATNSITSLALAQDGHELALGFVNGIIVFIAKQTPPEIMIRKVSESGIQKLWFADNLYVMSQDATVSIWSHAHRISQSLEVKIPGNNCRDAFTWGPYLPLERDVGKRKALILYDLRRGKDQMVVTLPSTADVCSSAAHFGGSDAVIRLSADYSPIYVVSSGHQPQIDSWDNPVHDPSGLRSQLGLARVSQDGSRLFAISNGSSLVLFDLESRRLIANIELHRIQDIAISGDGRRVLTASMDGILIWDFKSDDWKNTAIKLAGGNSDADRQSGHRSADRVTGAGRPWL